VHESSPRGYALGVLRTKPPVGGRFEGYAKEDLLPPRLGIPENQKPPVGGRFEGYAKEDLLPPRPEGQQDLRKFLFRTF